MDKRELAESLRKLAEDIRDRARDAEKTAEARPVMLDPQRVLDFMLFFGR